MLRPNKKKVYASHKRVCCFFLQVRKQHLGMQMSFESSRMHRAINVLSCDNVINSCYVGVRDLFCCNQVLILQALET